MASSLRKTIIDTREVLSEMGMAMCVKCDLGTVEPKQYTIIGAMTGTKIVTLCRFCDQQFYRMFVSRGIKAVNR